MWINLIWINLVANVNAIYPDQLDLNQIDSDQVSGVNGPKAPDVHAIMFCFWHLSESQFCMTLYPEVNLQTCFKIQCKTFCF